MRINSRLHTSIILVGVLSWSATWSSDSTKAGDSKSPHGSFMKMEVSHTVDTTTRMVDSTYRFVVDVRHRVFASFREIDTVLLNQRFPIGEGEYEGQIITFNPHLLITDKGEYLEGSDSLFNPAVRVRLFKGDSILQQNWAFYYSDAPHFRRNDILGFKLVSFEVPERFVRVSGPQIIAPAPVDTTKKETEKK